MVYKINYVDYNDHQGSITQLDDNRYSTIIGTSPLYNTCLLVES